MKRNVIILVLVAALFLSACVQSEVGKQPTDEQQPSFCEVTRTCDSLEEYSKYLEKAEYLPNNFVAYSDLENFGTFRWYAYWLAYPRVKPGESGYFDPYLHSANYYVTDANMVNFTIGIIYDTGKIRYRETLEFDETVTDMRTYPGGKTGTVYRNGINYFYYEGRLFFFVIDLGDLEIQFRENTAINTYPMSGVDTPLKRLLSADIEVAASVVEELAAKLAQ